MRPLFVSFFIPSFNIGGAEKALIELANMLAQMNWHVDILVMAKDGPLIHNVNSSIDIVDLKCNKYSQAIMALRKYFNSSNSQLVLTSVYSTGLTAIVARLISRKKPKIIVGAHNSLYAKINQPDNFKDKHFLLPLCRLLFPKADGIVAVSKGLASEIRSIIPKAKNKIITIYNPVIGKKFKLLSEEMVDHPWFNQKNRSYKIIVTAGRLVYQKGFDILLKSVYEVQKKVECRLVIIGSGPLLSDLMDVVHHQRMTNYVEFLGWQENPYKYFAKADLFVLSSRWEGLGNVLIEALSCGCKVVSTNCQFGPAEILEDGKYGLLAIPNNIIDLSKNILISLGEDTSNVFDKSDQISRSLDFEVEKSALSYDSYFREHLSN